MSYLRNPYIHENRRRGGSDSAWVASFGCSDMKPLIICRGPIRIEAMNVFEEMGITDYGMLLSEKDSIIYTNALSPELRKQIHPSRVHRVRDYSGATKEERQERIDQIIQIAKGNGYDCVFAGYGFMAEEEDLVKSLEEAGLNFLGPQSRTIREAGRKDLAKRTALAVDVSVTPGVDNATVLTLLGICPDQKKLIKLAADNDLQVGELDGLSLEQQAEQVLSASYARGIDLITIDEVAATLTKEIETLFKNDPEHRIRLKAVGGGGGKGQRILDAPVHFDGKKAGQLKKAIAAVEPLYREVLAEVKATGVGDNKNVLAEVNIETVRHQEIQVVGNGDWCITMGGRDCSLQMNEQKLLEVSTTQEELSEAIAAAKGDSLASLETDLKILKRMEEEAARFGAAVGLDSVSTFECIIEDDHHYFMEMNTRVQVEHRVTELCYALRFSRPDDASDSFVVNSIVELMVLLAAHGPRLPEPVRESRESSSVEVRLNATDQALKPHAGGVITAWSETLTGEIRDDQGICLHNPDTDVFMKYHLAGAYDSNIALLLTVDEDRDKVLSRMAEILRCMWISGENLSTNLEFQYGLLSWLIGQNAQARPATNFVMPYLSAVGELKRLANDLDIVQAYSATERGEIAKDKTHAVQISEIMNRKASLLARAMNRLFSEPHFLAGWLSLNQQRFEITEDGITWLSNPVMILRDLYHYLNMESENGLPALYAIWDHDQSVLADSISFYEVVGQKLGTDDWREIDDCLSGTAKQFGDQADAVKSAHRGFQLGLDILSILPYIGMKTGFFDLKVLPDLSISIPERLFNAADSVKELSPPPAVSADAVTAPSGGMYYGREAPDRETFVKEGDHFEEGDPLFIIEVMKMFNKVYAPFSGTVDRVLISSDATIVKRGEVVLKVTPDEEIVVQTDADIAARVKEATSAFIEFAGYS